MALTKVTDKQVTYKQGGTGSVVRNLGDRLREVVSVMDFIPSGTVTATTNCSTYFASALAAADTVYVPAGTYRLNSTLTIASGKRIYGDGISDTTIHSYAAASACVASSAGVLSDLIEVCGINVIAKSSATAIFDFSTARNGKFDDLQAVMNERTGGGGCYGFYFNKTTGAVANYRNHLSNSYAFDTGATAASSVGVSIGRSGDGANANTFTNVVSDGSNRGFVLTDSYGCRFYGCHAINCVTEAVLVINSLSNTFDIYVENCPAAGTVDGTSFYNEFRIMPDAGTPTALSVGNSRCKVSNFITRNTQTSPSNGVIHDTAEVTWTGTASKNFGVLTLGGVEGSAIVRITAAGVTTAAGGASGTATFVINYKNADSGTMTATGTPAVTGTLTNITATTSVVSSKGVITFALVAHATLENSFIYSVDILHVSHTGTAVAPWGETTWVRS